jgi:hypothetical protein
MPGAQRGDAGKHRLTAQAAVRDEEDLRCGVRRATTRRLMRAAAKMHGTHGRWTSVTPELLDEWEEADLAR